MIPLSKPTVTGREIDCLKRCLDDGWLSSAGPVVEEFEQRLAERATRRHAVAVSSGSAALHLALIVAGVKPGDLVLTQGFSFVATANSVYHAGAEPLFIDSDPDSWNMSAQAVEDIFAGCERRSGGLFYKETGQRIAAVLPALVYGLCGGVDNLRNLAHAAGVPLVVDAAEAMGQHYKGKPSECYGDISCMSFNGNKIMTTGSGGAIYTDSADIAKACHHLSTQSKTDWLDHIHDLVGYNYRMAAVNAAVGLAQLDALDDFLAAKEKIAKTYREAFLDCPGIQCMPEQQGGPDRPWLFSILVEGDGRTLVEKLNKAGIGARRLWRPLNEQRPFADSPCQPDGLPTAELLYAQGLSLPSSVGLDETTQATVIDALKKLVGPKGAGG